MSTFTERLAYRTYQCVMTLAWPRARARYLRRARQEPAYGEHLPEREARYDESPSHGWVWIHAVSLGETRAVAPLVAWFREHRPQMRILLTHGTATGREAGRALLRPEDRQVWLPWDTDAGVRRFLAHFRPRMGLLAETEVWPALVKGCREAGVPLWLINARLSDRSLRSSLRLAWLARPAFGSLAGVCAQTEDDAARLRQLGAPVVAVTGNLKFDRQPDAAARALGQGWRAAMSRRPVVMLASSREGEETLWLQAWQPLRTSFPQVLWLVVPRHPQRFDAVDTLLREAGLSVVRRSAWTGGPSPEQAGADVWLGDSIGEMGAYYAAADLALLGGSFEPFGGQNLIEAAACDCPVILGPHTFNFADAAERAVALGAARRVADIDEGVRIAMAWVADPAILAQGRAGAARLLAEGAGALERTVRALPA